jgi:alpha-mannosidase
LNNCKYGHDIKDHTIRLTLLRSPTYPDPEADQGEHAFSYSLVPHPGDWREGETIRHAYLFNMPAHGRLLPQSTTGSLPDAFSLVHVDRPGVVIETVKPAEDGDGLIVRLYEAHNTRGTAALTFGVDIHSAEEVNMLEEPIGRADIAGRELRVAVRPYGIASYRVRLRE